MPRKKKEDKIIIIDDILKYIKDNISSKVDIIKLDGITLECTFNKKENAKSKIDELKLLCSQLKIKNISFEQDETNKNIIAIQFPELENILSEKQIEKLYKDSFKWLLDTLISNDIKHEVTDLVLRESKPILVKQAIQIYYRGFVNQYKSDIKDYLDNPEYKNNINKLFDSYLQEYIIKRNEK